MSSFALEFGDARPIINQQYAVSSYILFGLFLVRIAALVVVVTRRRKSRFTIDRKRHRLWLQDVHSSYS